MRKLVLLTICALLVYLVYDKYATPRPAPPHPTGESGLAEFEEAANPRLAELEEAAKRRKDELENFQDNEQVLVGIIEREEPHRTMGGKPSLAAQKAMKALSEIRGRIAHAEKMLVKYMQEIEQPRADGD
jgi:hypothetical protein